MKILELTNQQLRENDIRGKGIVVESQNYGKDEELSYRVAVGDDFAQELLDKNIGREVEDTGRTAGFWQNFAGNGIHKPEEVNALHFSENLTAQLKTSPSGEISTEGDTWADIINNFPYTTDGVRQIFNLASPKDSESQKSSPKEKRTKKSVTTE